MRRTFFFRIRQLSHLLLVGTPTIAHSDIGWSFENSFLTRSTHWASNQGKWFIEAISKDVDTTVSRDVV
jgi:hypothetical protein